MRPLRQAVNLVDAHKRQAWYDADLPVHDCLGAHEQNVDFATVKVLDEQLEILFGQSRVAHGRAQALADVEQLVLHE